MQQHNESLNHHLNLKSPITPSLTLVSFIHLISYQHYKVDTVIPLLIMKKIHRGKVISKIILVHSIFTEHILFADRQWSMC